MTREQTAETVEPMRLIRRAQAGDLAAYEQFFERYYSSIHRLARQRVGRHLRRDVESRDVINEAMIEAIRSFDRFELPDRSALFSALGRVFERQLQTLRRCAQTQTRDRDVAVALRHIQDAVTSGRLVLEQADDALAEDEEIALLAKCLEELDNQQRAVVVLRESEGLSWDEIARRVGCPSTDAARMVFARARIALKRELEQRLDRR